MTKVADELAQAIVDLVGAAQAEARGREACADYCWPHEGRHLVEARVNAEQRFSDLLEVFVDERIEATKKGSE